MRDLMHRLSNEGKTVFISSHILSEIQQICTRVAIINHGQLITETTVEELTRGTGDFTVKVDNAQDALALIRRQPWGQEAHLDEHGALVTAAPNLRGRDLNLFLVQNGFPPDSLALATQDLEKVFLELTDSKGGDVK
jgi:ABC-2 type transport system ATP-binding protein